MSCLFACSVPLQSSHTMLMAAVFIVIAIALVLGKTDLSREAVPYEFYDWFLFGTWLLLVPIGFVLTVISKLRFVKHVLYGDETGPKRAFNRLYVGLKSEEDVEDFKAYLGTNPPLLQRPVHLSHTWV